MGGERAGSSFSSARPRPADEVARRRRGGDEYGQKWRQKRQPAGRRASEGVGGAEPTLRLGGREGRRSSETCRQLSYARIPPQHRCRVGLLWSHVPMRLTCLHVTLCKQKQFTIPNHAMPCHAVPCHAMQCHSMPCQTRPDQTPPPAPPSPAPPHPNTSDHVTQLLRLFKALGVHRLFSAAPPQCNGLSS